MSQLGSAWAWLLLNNFSTILHLRARRSDAVLAPTVWLGPLAAIICKVARLSGLVGPTELEREPVPEDFFLLSLRRSSGPCSESPSRPDGESVILRPTFSRPVVMILVTIRSYLSPFWLDWITLYYFLSCFTSSFTKMIADVTLCSHTLESRDTLVCSPLPSQPAPQNSRCWQGEGGGTVRTPVPSRRACN